MPLAGGLMQHGYQCGMIWGAALAAGAQAYRLHSAGTRAETGAMIAAQQLVKSFRSLNNYVNCIDITSIDKSSTAMQMFTYFFLKGGTISCMRMAVKYAPAAFKEINSALAGESRDASFAPVSCAALLAKKLGASDMHAAMAAGLAGGIGLSGGACGALGAAVWINGMNRLRGGAAKLDFMDPEAQDVIARFVQRTGSKFECSKIVGRRFKDVDDHASYVRGGGCSKIIETLAARQYTA